MNVEDLEKLIRRYVSTGVTVAIILVAPATDTDTAERPADPSVVAVEADGTWPVEPSAGERSTASTDRSGSGAGSADGRRGSAWGKAQHTDGSRRHPGPDSGTAYTGQDRSGPDSRTGAGGTDPGRDHEPDLDRTEANGLEGRSIPNDDVSRIDGEGGSAGRRTADERTSPDPRPRGQRDTTGERSEAGPSTGTGSRTSNGTTAAERHGWGTPNRVDDFSSGVEQWSIYDGPGYGGQGMRSPSAVALDDGILTITGDSSGTTAGMAWNPGQKYGRWEGRVRAPAADPSYQALLLLWPDAEDFPVGGEVDFMEMSDAARQKTDLFIHSGEDNSQVNGQVEIDATEWHNWAVEWTPDAITGYVDGEEWYRTTDPDILPPGPMHLCIQLDWFPEDGTPRESIMQVDWVRQYSLAGSAEPGSRSSNDGDSADADPASDRAGERGGQTGGRTIEEDSQHPLSGR